MTKVLSIVGECILMVVLATIAVSANVPSTPMGILFALFLSLSLAPIPSFVQPEFLRRDQKFFLAAVLSLACSLPVSFATAVPSLGVGIVAALCLSYGVVSAIEDRRAHRPWSQTRREILLSIIILIIASTATVMVNHGLLAYRSHMGIVPGRVDFLFLMGVLAAGWFGFDAALCRLSPCQRPGIGGWLLNRRYSVLLGLVAVIIIMRSAV